MKKLLFILLVLPATAMGQVELQYSPQSVIGWGRMPESKMISAQYKSVGIMHIQGADHLGYLRGDRIVRQATGLFAVPITINTETVDIQAGGIYFDKAIPTHRGTKFNFYLSVSYTVKIDKLQLGLEYVHVSNGWTGEINPGFDFPTMSIKFDL